MSRFGGVVRAVLVGAVLASVACVGGGGKGLSQEDKDKLKPYVLEVMPTDMPHQVDIDFEHKVHLIGYKFEPEMAKPGSEVKFTFYWRCDDSVEEGWSLFTHVRDDATDKTDNLDWNGVLRESRNNRQLLGPDRWEKGKFYVDEQTYKVPGDIKGAELTVMTGIWKGDARLRITSGANDGDNRAIVGKLKTGLTPAPADQHTNTEVPSLLPLKLAAADKIVVDGKGDDKAWEGAVSTGPFVDVSTGQPAAGSPVGASAKVAWDDTNLYVLFDVSDNDIVAGFTAPEKQKDEWTTTGQPKLWTKDTVEIMIEPDPNGDNHNYYEIQINPQNKVFHTQYDTYNQPKQEPNGPFGHEDWDPKLTSKITVKGTVDRPGDKDEGYMVEASIPWASFTKAQNHPPKPGDVWRMDFYAMKNNSAVSVAWSPILKQGNFHKASRFGKVTWMVPGMAPPAASASAAPSPAVAVAGEAGAPGPLHLPIRPGMARGPMMGSPRALHPMTTGNP